MIDAISKLVESGAISEDTQKAIQDAWESKIKENKETVGAELREEFAKRYEHDKANMIEAIDKMMSEKLSEEIISYELSSLGFVPATSTVDADFYVIITWRKALSFYSNPTDHIDPYAQVLARKDDRVGRFTPRLNLLLEIYSNSKNEVFWRNELPNIFDAPELTENRVKDSLKRAIKGFPARIIKDPNLPSIQ